MFVYGVQPSQELWEKKPENLSVASAGAAWQTGFGDGAESTTHAIFEDEGVQMFYDEGYGRGQEEKRVADQINNRHGTPPESESSESENEPESEQATGRPGIEIHVETDKDTLIRDSALVLSAVSLAAIAAALWLGMVG